MARFTPTEWDALTDSWQLDPPLDDVFRSVRSLLAQLIADQRNIHRGKDTQAVTAADFLPSEADEDDEHDEDAQPEQPVMPDAMAMWGARRYGALTQGHGAKPPSAAIEAFFGKAEGES